MLIFSKSSSNFLPLGKLLLFLNNADCDKTEVIWRFFPSLLFILLLVSKGLNSGKFLGNKPEELNRYLFGEKLFLWMGVNTCWLFLGLFIDISLEKL